MVRSATGYVKLPAIAVPSLDSVEVILCTATTKQPKAPVVMATVETEFVPIPVTAAPNLVTAAVILLTAPTRQRPLVTVAVAELETGVARTQSCAVLKQVIVEPVATIVAPRALAVGAKLEMESVLTPGYAALRQDTAGIPPRTVATRPQCQRLPNL